MLDRKAIKERAKSMFLGNYWLAVGLFAILGAITGMASSYSGMISGFTNLMNLGRDSIPTVIYLLVLFVILVISCFEMVVIFFLCNPFSVTTAKVALDIYDGEKPRFSNIFYCFKNRRYWRYVGTMALFTLFGALVMLVPMILAIIIAAVVFAVSYDAGAMGLSSLAEDMYWLGPLSLIAAGGMLLGMIPFWILMCGLSQTPFILAEDDTASGMEVLKRSWRMMRGHKWEYFVFNLSFIGWWFVLVFSFGIAGVFYVGPYMNTALAGWHRELAEKE